MMVINDREVHQRKVITRIDEKDIKKILIDHVIKETGIEINSDTEIKCYISSNTSSISTE
jgi:hypothetical protein